MNHIRTRATRLSRRALTLVGLSVAAATGGASAVVAAPAPLRAAARDDSIVRLSDSIVRLSARRDSLVRDSMILGSVLVAEAPAVPAAPSRGLSVLLDSLRGRSGKLRARIVGSFRGGLALPVVQAVLGDSALDKPGVHAVTGASPVSTLSLITLIPFASKSGARVESYRVGYWPGERRAIRSPEYDNPAGFIRVTPENQDTRISEHFRLRDFLTHDQQDVWPKYLVLREDLVDKLELVIADLEAHGHPVQHMTVMSGFRTPQYNQQGVGRGGRAKDSRHQFGDAADVFVDNDGDGRMDDLNHDRRVDSRDAQIIIDAADRVERAHPDLVGGAGRYRATRAHGPFAHIDVRGSRARWGNA